MNRLIAAATVSMITIASQAGVPEDVIITNFRTGFEGWSQSGDVIWTPGGGFADPGMLRFQDGGSGSGGRITAPSTYTGDLSRFIGGTFSFALAVVERQPGFFNPSVQITGNGETLSWSIPVGSSSSSPWQLYEIDLVAATFGDRPDFAAIMSDVTRVRISLPVSNTGSETVHIDNIAFVVPSPAAALPLALVAAASATRRRRHTT